MITCHTSFGSLCRLKLHSHNEFTETDVHDVSVLVNGSVSVAELQNQEFG